MNDLIVKINKSTRKVILEQIYIGNDHENLQENLVFQFDDEFVNGQGRLEYEIDGNKNYIILQKEGETYTIPVQNVVTVYQEETSGKIKFQLVVTEGTEAENIPVFKSNVFYLRCRPSINAVTEAPEGYDLWIEQANAKLNLMDEALQEVENLNISAERVQDGVEIAITNKEGIATTTTVNDGYTPQKGVDYFTAQDIEGIETDVENDIQPILDNKADKSEIPDVSNFITNTVDDLVNYYLKSDTYTKTEVNNLIGSIEQLHFEIVQELPETGQSNIIYLVPRTDSEESNVYDEYIYANNEWEKIGSTDIDLSDYVTTTQLNTALANYTTTTDLTALLDVKLSIIEGSAENLFNEENLNKGHYIDADGVVQVGENFDCIMNIPVKENTNYIFQKKSGDRMEVTAIYYKADGTFISRKGNINSTSRRVMFKTVPGTQKLGLSWRVKSSGATYTYEEVMLSEGKVIREYKSYKKADSKYIDFKHEVENYDGFSLELNSFSAFQRFAVIGDSLSVGYTAGYTDRALEYSWGQLLAKKYGNSCINMGKSGYDVSEWLESQDYGIGVLNATGNKCQAYCIGLGVNDGITQQYTINDFKTDYQQIITAIKTVNADAKIFCFTMMQSTTKDVKNEAIREIVGENANTYLVDMDRDFKFAFTKNTVSNYYVGSHYSPAGYSNIGDIIGAVISYVMDNRGDDFTDIVAIPYDKPVKVDDVQMNGTSIVNNGVANIPIGTTQSLGVVKAKSDAGTTINQSGELIVNPASDQQIKEGTGNRRPITPDKENASVFYGLAKASGDTTQASSSNAVGTYTPEAKTKIMNMLGDKYELISTDVLAEDKTIFEKNINNYESVMVVFILDTALTSTTYITGKFNLQNDATEYTVFNGVTTASSKRIGVEFVRKASDLIETTLKRDGTSAMQAFNYVTSGAITKVKVLLSGNIIPTGTTIKIYGKGKV